ncbi:DDHD domain-domain-containing protein [Leucosporidium creatinivorum]|uniref:DDHD domain-domain-containing protein n=1 Tax=Leucosporidium creatinivorum TaxID=106004 RepID=A0A1Y2FL31_9BASI|nr:DDHD domain-domain-containing protein [Leucosporidium creatinivorum]
MDDYFALQPTGVHDDGLPSNALPPSEEAGGYTSPFDSPTEESTAVPQAEPPLEGARQKAVLSPSERIAVLDQEASPPPAPDARFLHGGPPLSALDAPSTVPILAGGAAGGKPIATARWRAFTDEEERRLQIGWRELREEREAGEGKEEEEGTKEGAEDPDADLPHHHPVGLDRLFTVSLTSLILYPAFWTGTPVRVLLSHWFYAPPSPSSSASTSTPSHELKPYPVDPELAEGLDRAYASIRPWEESYEQELSAALKGGTEAQKRVCVSLGVGNESGVDPSKGAGIEVVFASANEGRVYSKGFLGSVGKGFWRGGKTLGGGQVVLRGWDAMRTYHARKAAQKHKKAVPSTSESLHDSSDTDSIVSASKHDSTSSPTKPSFAPSTDAGFFSLLKSKIYGAPTNEQEQEQGGEDGEERANETAEAMAGPRNREGEEGVGEVGEVDELVLVCHGIGQKLAGAYESFNFVHAVNQLRSACTTLSTSPTLSPLLHSKRAQFIPLLWRTDLQFEDEVDESNDSADEHLRNRFSLDDIEIKGNAAVPFLRQVVSGLVLDVPFYLSHHKEKMMKAVVKEANKIYRLFILRNPSFATHGRVSIIAHSLGSALISDILSLQPTFVSPLSQMSPSEKYSEEHFVFDTRTVFLVGSPLAFFMHLGKGQLIARAGRERTKEVGRDIALDRKGRYGCLAVDSVYNVYHETDPVAFALNATVDVKYSTLIKPIAISSTNQSLLQNLSETYNRVSRVFDFSALWSSTSTAPPEQAPTEEELVEEASKTRLKEEGPPKVTPFPKRPGGGKRMPSERPMGVKEFEVVSRAEKRFNALNPNGCIDFYLPAEGFNQYLEALSSHGSYWTDPRFSTFVLTQLFASTADLQRTGRDQIGETTLEED